VQHPLAERNDQPGLLGEGNEVVGRDYAALGMDADALEGGVGQIVQAARLERVAVGEALVDDRAGEADAEQQQGDACDRDRKGFRARSPSARAAGPAGSGSAEAHPSR
jgi:hypothetical protein